MGVRPSAVHLAPFFKFPGGPFGVTDPLSTGGFGFGGVIGDPATALFGVTSGGGDQNCAQGGCGVVYAIIPSGSRRAETILHTFRGPDGDKPLASLVQDAQGTLYGTTLFGGASSYGTVFSLSPGRRPTKSGYKERVLYSFQGKADGGFPESSVLLGPGGTIFGTATYYGASNFGTVFELTPNGTGYTERTLYTFSGGADGGYPAGGLTAGANGVLFGTTGSGGLGYGTVFTLTPSGSTYSENVIYPFEGGSDGRNPDNANLTQDASGALYGVTPGGGSDDNGVVYKLTPSSSGYSEQVLRDFSAFRQGTQPFASLVLRKGRLYGTTASGGRAVTCDGSYDGCGTVFTLSTIGRKFAVIHTFSGRKDGGLPFSPMILAPNGALYGTTTIGGGAGFGTIFQIVFAN